MCSALQSYLPIALRPYEDVSTILQLYYNAVVGYMCKTVLLHANPWLQNAKDNDDTSSTSITV